MLTQYREKLHLNDVRKGITKQKKSIGYFTGLSSVIILLDARDKSTMQLALNYAKRLEKKANEVIVLGYVQTKEAETDLPFECFSNKELDWLWRPKNDLISQFNHQKFDLLINLCQTECFPLEYLAVSLDANYKIGALTNYPNNYNLMLDSKNLENYLKQVDFFLNKFSN